VESLYRMQHTVKELLQIAAKHHFSTLLDLKLHRSEIQLFLAEQYATYGKKDITYFNDYKASRETPSKKISDKQAKTRARAVSQEVSKKWIWLVSAFPAEQVKHERIFPQFK
jgi:hypothetical protein